MRKLEICCGSIEDVKIAARFNIDSIELNSSLSLGGITPTIGTLRAAKEITDIPIYCMNRPVAGGFVYSDVEFDVMLRDGNVLIDNGADGLVFGCLTEQLTIDLDKTKELIDLAHKRGKLAIFHMAMDSTPDMESSYRMLIELGINRVLTSGRGKTAVEGLPMLKRLHEINPDRLIIGSGVHKESVHHFSQFKYLHGSCKTTVYRNNGTAEKNHDYVGKNLQHQADPVCIEALLKAIK